MGDGQRGDMQERLNATIETGLRGSGSPGTASGIDHLAEGAPAPFVLMVGTSPEMRGGIASVVAAIREGGFFAWANVFYVITHVQGNGLRKAWQFLRAIWITTRTLVNEPVAIVHAHVSSRGSFWRKAMLLWIARRFGVPTIFHLHSGGFSGFADHGLGGRFLQAAIRSTLEASTTVVVLTERWAEWVREFAPRSRVRVVGNPVRIPEFAGEVRSTEERGRGGRVLFLGLICDAKGSFDLLRAWVAFRARVPHWRLVVGGNGEVDRFLQEARRLGIGDDVEYVGWLTGPEKDRELLAADIFVLPSYKEGMPVSILEAMAFGVAVIATPVGGVPDMMKPEVHGLWVQPGDVGALAQTLERLASSPALRAALARASRQHVTMHYSTETVLERLKSVYREIVAEFGDRRRPLS
jgi:glycosyltransferase involved in cell wall biosynthesis